MAILMTAANTKSITSDANLDPTLRSLLALHLPDRSSVVFLP
jgi:hypothetical protein